MDHCLITGHRAVCHRALTDAGYFRVSPTEWESDTGKRVEYVDDPEHVRGRDGRGCKILVCIGYDAALIRDARLSGFQAVDFYT